MSNRDDIKSHHTDTHGACSSPTPQIQHRTACHLLLHFLHFNRGQQLAEDAILERVLLADALLNLIIVLHKADIRAVLLILKCLSVDCIIHELEEIFLELIC